jgi:hypothetical protein
VNGSIQSRRPASRRQNASGRRRTPGTSGRNRRP